MTATVETRRPRRRGRTAVIAIAVLSAAVVLYSVPAYVMPEVDPRVGIREDVPFHLPFLIVHAVTAGIALLIGPFQFFASIREKHPRIHRTIGRTYLLAGILPSSLSGIVVAVLTTAGPLPWITFTALDVLWFYSGLRAYRAVRARDFEQHRRWMMRNFAMTFAAVNLRVYLGLFIAVQIPLLDGYYGGDFDALFNVAYTTAVVTSIWGNMIFMELYLRRRRTRDAVAAAA